MAYLWRPVCAGRTYSRIHDEKVGRAPSIRSQTEMATRWIQLLQEEGFLAEDSSLSESPTGIRPKNSNIICAILASKRRCFVMSISPAVEERSPDLAESDLAALADTRSFLRSMNVQLQLEPQKRNA